MDKRIRNLIAVIDLVLLKGEVQERQKVLKLVDELRLSANTKISKLGTDKDNIQKINLQIQYLNKMDSVLRSFSNSKKEDLVKARDKYLGSFEK